MAVAVVPLLLFDGRFSSPCEHPACELAARGRKARLSSTNLPTLMKLACRRAIPLGNWRRSGSVKLVLVLTRLGKVVLVLAVRLQAQTAAARVNLQVTPFRDLYISWSSIFSHGIRASWLCHHDRNSEHVGCYCSGTTNGNPRRLVWWLYYV